METILPRNNTTAHRAFLSLGTVSVLNTYTMKKVSNPNITSIVAISRANMTLNIASALLPCDGAEKAVVKKKSISRTMVRIGKHDKIPIRSFKRLERFILNSSFCDVHSNVSGHQPVLWLRKDEGRPGAPLC